MLHDISLTPAQVHALFQWASQDADAAPVMLAAVVEAPGAVEVGQGDERAIITPEGEVVE